MARACGSYPQCPRFESVRRHQLRLKPHFDEVFLLYSRETSRILLQEGEYNKIGEFHPYFTNDGSVGLFNTDFDDIYHSATGALTEAYEKFIYPVDFDALLKKKSIKVLDICYGIGYNTKSFLNFLFGAADRRCGRRNCKKRLPFPALCAILPIKRRLRGLSGFGRGGRDCARTVCRKPPSLSSRTPATLRPTP